MKHRPASRPRNFSRFLSRAVFALAAARAAAATTDIRLGTVLPDRTPQHQLLVELAAQWQKESAGTVKLIVHAGGVMGDESAMVRKMKHGQLAAGLLTSNGLAEIDPAVTGLMFMPLIYRSWAEVDYVREKMRPLLESRLRAQGYEVLFWADAGWIRFFSKTAAFRPEDFRPMKLFAWVGDERQVALMKSIGFWPVPLESTNIPLGLGTGMIAAAPVPPLAALGGQIYRAAPHMLDLKWCPIVGATVVRTDLWEKIPAALRMKLAAAATPVGEKMRARGRTDDGAFIAAMEKNGLQVHAVPADALPQWEKLATDVYPKIRGNMVPAEIFDAVQQHLRDFRAANPATP
ncbi:MAG: hypothetical protein RLZZ15_3171 [Verrucomicrobiota bacterium]|jgi:TRAP-type C4-dicarboxylate transport system substrate-binding protein